MFAIGGLPSTLGFGALACAWLYTGWRAIDAARRRDFHAHRIWMIRNFSLSLAAVTLRLQIPALFAMGLPFESFYPVVAWICWIPNLLGAQLWLRLNPAPQVGAVNIQA
jgi:hypothetical protein